MQVLSLIQKHNIHFDLPIGKELGAGADGQCFELNNKVIKLSVLFEPSSKNYKQIKKVLQFVIDNQPNMCARVYEQGYIGKGYRSFLGAKNNKQKFLLYYYTMERLSKISDDEKRVFHSVISHNDSGFKKDYSINKIKSMLIEMNRFLDFEFDKVYSFCNALKYCPIDQNDIHERNIMKDNIGNFKLVDFDRSLIKEKYVTN